MAKSGIEHSDVGNELSKVEWLSEESHQLVHGSSFPASPVERQVFYRDDEHKWYIYNGSSWVSLQEAGGSVAYLNDIGDVNVPSPTNQHLLYWDAAAGKWQCKANWTAAHATTHQNAGADEINVAGLSGELADNQPPKAHSHTIIRDADTDTKVDVEESADEDKVRMDVAGTEAFLLDDAGVMTLAKQSRARAYQTSGQSIPASTETKVALNIEDYDEQSEYDHVTNYRFTAKTAGYYLVCGNAVFSTLADGKKYVVGAKKNASAWIGIGRGIIGGTEAAGASFSGVIYLAIDDYVEEWIYHDDTVARTLNATAGYNQMSVHKLS